MSNIFILLGPTASGKSQISYQLANDFDFEIINADLFSIYKHLNIGTDKPSKNKFKTYKHYLFDKLEPNETYNVSKYCHDALSVIDEILKRKKTPLFVGGTMMYVYQLLNGISHKYNLSSTDLSLIKAIQKKYSNEHIMKSLTNYNQKLTDKISINDSYRIEKILERLISSEKFPINTFNGLYNDNRFKINILFIDIKDRPHLKKTIKTRTQRMIDSGLVNEVEGLKKNFNISQQNQSMKAIGYKETLQYLDNNITLEELSSLITVSTQQLAKRQITWKNKFKISHSISYPNLDYTNLCTFITQTLK